MSIESLLTTKVIEAVKQCYIDVDKDKVQLQTGKEFAGDLTVVVFPFTRFRRNLRKRQERIGGYLKQHIED